MNQLNSENIIILRSVYKEGVKYLIQPCKNPKTGRYPDCVRKVNADGDMILFDDDKKNPKALIAENATITVTDGTTFNLDDPYSAAEWEAIQHCSLIAPSRDARDDKGNLIIDGDNTRNLKSFEQLQQARVGRAELYIERPGEDTKKRVNKKKVLHDARTFIFNDDYEGMLTKCKVLGREMGNYPVADVQDYLLEVAEREPSKVINLYTGEDMNLRILLIDARNKKVIQIKNRLYVYADDVILGATDDAVIAWMKNPANAKVLDLIKSDTYPTTHAETKKVASKAAETKQTS